MPGRPLASITTPHLVGMVSEPSPFSSFLLPTTLGQRKNSVQVLLNFAAAVTKNK